MPAVPKTSDEDVIRAAQTELERGGMQAFSMQSVAAAVGVRAPSLYKRFPDRNALLEAVAEKVAGDLRELIVDADRASSARAALSAMANAYRAFAQRTPHSYQLLFADRSAAGPSVPARAAAVAPVLSRLDALVGAKHSLLAARLLTSWLHGFVSMERAGAFRLGGDVDQAFAYGLTTLLTALKRP